MSFSNWVLDATIATPAGTFCFCPIEGDLEGDFKIVTGMNLISDKPNGDLLGIVHENGQQAVEQWCAEHAEELEQLKATLKQEKE